MVLTIGRALAVKASLREACDIRRITLYQMFEVCRWDGKRSMYEGSRFEAWACFMQGCLFCLLHSALPVHSLPICPSIMIPNRGKVGFSSNASLLHTPQIGILLICKGWLTLPSGKA